jgi:uncharacterized delta-60 repeat protein
MRAAALTVALALSSGSAVANYDGSLDTTLTPPFGADPYYGVPGLFDYEVNLGGSGVYLNDDTAAAVAVQVDGKIVVAGFSWNNYVGTDQNACVLERFNEDGSTDTAFGSNGRVVQDFTPQSGENDCYFVALALEGDGDIVAVGNLYDATHGERALIERFLPSGQRDTTFGTNGSGYVVLADDTAFSAIVADVDGWLYAAGRHKLTGFSDYDFYLGAFEPDGTLHYDRGFYFDLGADHDDRASALVLQKNICVGFVCTPHDELYVVGTANNTPYPDGLANHDCAILAYTREAGEQFDLDSGFNGTGAESIDETWSQGSGPNEGDNYCHAAVSRNGYGVLAGGETYGDYSGVGDASYASVISVDASGVYQYGPLQGFGYFASGIYNGIWAMAREPGGKVVGAGYGGSSDPDHQPSDVGLLRVNTDGTSVDCSFGNVICAAMLSLDGLGGLLPHQREWATAVALDNRGRIVFVGPRSVIYGVDEDYDWIVGRLVTSDEIFRDGVDGIVPPT